MDLFSRELNNEDYEKLRVLCAEKINSFFNKNKAYLDKQFALEFSSKFDSRFLELFVLNKIVKSDFFYKLSKNEECGPDFRINNFYNEKNLYIECVCPDDGVKGNYFPSGNFSIEEEVFEDGRSYSGSSKGVCDYITTRFTSCLKDKSEKYRRYVDNKIISSDSYKGLAVSSATLRRVKSNIYNTKEIVWSCENDFESAIFGDVRHYIDVDSGKFGVSFKDKKVVKKNGSEIVVGSNEYLHIYDFIVYSDIHVCSVSQIDCFIFFHQRIDEGLRVVLKSIFCPYVPISA